MFSRIFQFFTNSTSLFSLVSVKDEVITVHYRSEKDEPSVRNILKTLKQNNEVCRGSRYQGL